MQILGSSEKMAGMYPFPEAWTDVLSSEVIEWSFIAVLQIPRLEIMLYKGKTLGMYLCIPNKTRGIGTSCIYTIKYSDK